MNPDGSSLVYADQAAAEAVAGRRRVFAAELLNELQELNDTVDSHKLQVLIDEKRAEVEDVNF